MKILISCIFIYFTTCLGFKLQNTLESFHPCIIVQLHFDPHLSYAPSTVPSILADGSTVLSKSHSRKSLFCVVYFIFFPESELPADTIASKSWIYDYLLPIGIFLQEANFNELLRKYSPYLMEPHYILIISERPHQNWIPSLVHSVESVACYSSIYYLQVSVIKSSNAITEEFRIANIYYFCKYCFMTKYLLFRVHFARGEAIVSKLELDSFERFIYQNGERIYLHFGNQKFFNTTRTQSIYRPHLMKYRKSKEICPFSPKPELDMIMITEILLIQGLKYTLASIDFSNYTYDLVPYESYDKFWRHRPMISFQALRLNRLTFQRSFIVTNRLTFKFITCDGVTTYNNLSGVYRIVNCIDFTVWNLVVMSIVMSTIILHFLSNLTRFNHQTTSIPFNIVFFIAILFENGSDLNVQRHLRRHKPSFGTVVYFLLAGWVLGLVVMNNVYKGILTSDELAPPQPRLKWNHIHELVNFTIATPFIAGTENQTNRSIPVSQTLFWSTLNYMRHMVETYKQDFKYPSLFCFSKSPYKPKGVVKCDPDRPTYTLYGFHTEDRMGFYNAVSSCNSSAFVDLNSRIDDFLEFFNHQMKLSGEEKVFMKGSDDFLSPNLGWMMSGYHELYLGRLQRRLQSLIHSGILMIFEKWIDRSGLKKKRRNKSPRLGDVEVQSLSLSDIPGTVVQIQLLACASAGIIFIIELTLLRRF